MTGGYRAALAIAALFVCGLLVWVFWSWTPSSAPPAHERYRENTVQPRDCGFVSGYGFHVDCYWVPVGAQRAQARLAVAIFRAQDKDGAADPLVYIAGGPGEAGSAGAESLESWDHWLADVDIGRDLVLLDLRGLGPSEPAWDCEDYAKASRELLNRNLSFAEEGEIIAPVLADCLAAWREHLDLESGPVAAIADFSSQLNAADLGESLRHLGYQQWNYLAVSYGTRVALLAAMQQPEVRRVILDSPYPLERGSMSDSVNLWIEAFAHFWQSCEASSCEFSEAQFWQLMAELRHEPVWVEVENWRTGRDEKWLLNDGRLAAALYTAFYSSELTDRVAPALHNYVQGNRDELKIVLEIFFNQAFDSRFNSAIYWATECNDNRLEEEAEFQRALAAAGPWQAYFAQDWLHSVCHAAAFRPGQLPSMKPVSLPVLVVAGERDPITTQTHARELMRWLPQGYLLVQPGRSHAEFFMAPCGQHLIPWFLNAALGQLAAEWHERSTVCRRPIAGIVEGT